MAIAALRSVLNMAMHPAPACKCVSRVSRALQLLSPLTRTQGRGHGEGPVGSSVFDVGCSLFAFSSAELRTSNIEHPTPNLESQQRRAGPLRPPSAPVY